MSLSDFLSKPDVKAKIKPLRPASPRKIAVPLLVEPKTDHQAIVGMAFDYLLRFELHRRSPHAVTVPWVADTVLDQIWTEKSSGCGAGKDVLAHAFPERDRLLQEREKRIRKLRRVERAWVDSYLDPSLPPKERNRRAGKIEKDAAAVIAAYVKLRSPNREQRTEYAAHIIRLARLYPQCQELKKLEMGAVVGIDTYADTCPDGYLHPKEVQKRARKIVGESKTAVAAYLKLRTPNRDARAALSSYAIRLAKLDCVNYNGELDPRFEEADPMDIEDLLSLLAVVPFESLSHDRILLLNPPFSCAWGVYRADLITGDMLVDFKTTTRDAIQVDDLDQLFGYYLLARHQRQTDPTFPEIKRLALYFCRHAYLWPVDVTKWTDHPDFSEVEDWFFKRAKEEFGNPMIA